MILCMCVHVHIHTCSVDSTSVIVLLIWIVQAGVVGPGRGFMQCLGLVQTLFPAPLPVCLECPAPSPASAPNQQREGWWCTWPQDVARLPASENFRN